MSGESLVYGFLDFLCRGILLWLVGHLAFSVPIWYMSKLRGIKGSILAWIPLANLWFLGSLCDQYARLVIGKCSNRRWWLVTIGGITTTLIVAGAAIRSDHYTGTVITALWATVLDLLGMVLAGFILLSLHRVYFSSAPNSATAFFLLSVVIPISIPVFMVINMGKELGMPPRRKQFLLDLKERSYQLRWPTKSTE